MTLSAHGSPVHSCNVLALWWRDALPDQLVAVAPRVTYGHTDRSQEILRFTGPRFARDSSSESRSKSGVFSLRHILPNRKKSPPERNVGSFVGSDMRIVAFLGGYRRLMGPRIASAG